MEVGRYLYACFIDLKKAYYIRTQNGNNKSLNIWEGVCKGSVLSPILFNVASIYNMLFAREMLVGSKNEWHCD